MIVQMNEEMMTKVLSKSLFPGAHCANLVNCVRQGGVITSTSQESWYRHNLVSPPGYKIYRLGISGGCSVTPFHQVMHRNSMRF